MRRQGDDDDGTRFLWGMLLLFLLASLDEADGNDCGEDIICRVNAKDDRADERTNRERMIQGNRQVKEQAPEPRTGTGYSRVQRGRIPLDELQRFIRGESN